MALLALHWQLPQALAGNTSFAMQTAGVRIITPSGACGLFAGFSNAVQACP